MNCWHCERPAHGTCRFCGRAVCKEHAKPFPYILELYRSDGGMMKALLVADALHCGICQPREDPIDLPQLR